MRVFAVSDIHVDYKENLAWTLSLDNKEYANDILILAGDVTDKMSLLKQVLVSLAASFKAVMFVPGNHELWVQENDFDCSLDSSRQSLNFVNHVAFIQTFLSCLRLASCPCFLGMISPSVSLAVTCAGRGAIFEHALGLSICLKARMSQSTFLS